MSYYVYLQEFTPGGAGLICNVPIGGKKDTLKECLELIQSRTDVVMEPGPDSRFMILEIGLNKVRYCLLREKVQ